MCKMCETLKPFGKNSVASDDMTVNGVTVWLVKDGNDEYFTLGLNDGNDHCAVEVHYCPFCGKPLDK